MSDRDAGLTSILPLLACPHCSGGLEWTAPGVAGCSTGHRFDVARRGYLPLLGARSRTDTGDSADMVAARVAFLDGGHYLPIAEAVAARVTAGPILDLGAGTGYHLAAALRRLAEVPQARSAHQDTSSIGLTTGVTSGAPVGESIGMALGVAIDASKYAAGRSAAAHPGIGSVLADAWSALPVRSGVAATVLNVFAPRDPAEIHRVLGPGGRLIVVTPEPDHLGEIRSELGLLTVDPGKSERLDATFSGLLRTVDRAALRRQMMLSGSDVRALVRMGPSARHLEPDRLERAVMSLPARTTVTMSVTISVLHRN